MECIDCHTAQDSHGDGNIYSKREEGVEIECVDCHGTQEQRSTLTSSEGNPLKNLRKVNSHIVLTTKMHGQDLVIPQAKDVVEKGPDFAMTAMGIATHMDKLECYTCHTRWAPQCYGCHAQQDLAEKSTGWIETKTPADPTKSGTKANKDGTTAKWRETRSYVRWEDPILGINSEERVSPFITGCQVVFTQIGEDGKATIQNKIFETYDGFSGLAHNPIQPHTIVREARSCESCHASTKALGLGSGFYISEKNGLDIDFELERIVDEEGNQIQATSHYGARPFNKEEIEKIRRVNVCASCHNLTVDEDIWEKVTDIQGFAKTNATHKKLLERIFQKGVGLHGEDD